MQLDYSKANLSSGKRLRHVRKVLGLSQQDMSEQLNISQGTLSQIENDYYHLSFHTLNTLYQKWEVNSNWLITGQGKIFHRETPREQDNANVAVVTGTAVEEYPARRHDPTYLDKLPTCRLPEVSSDKYYRVFQLTDDSMHPTLSLEDLLICQYQNSTIHLAEGDLVVAVTDTLLTRRYYLYEEDTQFALLKADNTAFLPHVVELKRIQELWAVRSRLTHQIPPSPAQQARRVDQLEADIRRLEEQLQQLISK